MRFRSCVTRERALSPTVGVLLIGVTVVLLALAVGAYVSGFGNQQTTPKAAWETTATMNKGNVTTVEFRHAGGDKVDARLLSVRVDDDSRQVETNVLTERGTSIVASFNGSDHYDAGTRVRLVFSPSGSGETTTLTTYELTNSSTGTLSAVTAS